MAWLGAVVALAGCSGPLPAGWSYSTRVTSTSATVVWTAPHAERVICRGPAGSPTSASGVAGSNGLRSARLEGLRPATVYRCTLDPPAPGAARLRFRTAPLRGTRFRFAVVGDSGDAGPTARALARRILAGRPDFLVHLGDMTYVGRDGRAYDRAFFAPYRRLLARVPIFPTPGNHDLVSRGVYRTVFAPVADVDDAGGPRYAFTWADGVFVSVTSMGVAGNPTAARWLDEALRQAPADAWRVLFLHEPPFAPGSKWVTLGLRRTLTAVLAGPTPPDLLLAGHEHGYARSAPICNGVPGRGTLEIISGGGGQHLDAPSAQAGFPVDLVASHYVRVAVTPAALDVRAVGVDGAVLDHVHVARQGVLVCRADGWPAPLEKRR